MKTVTILIVEDESIVAEDIKRSLERFGYNVCGVASTGRTAINIVEEHKPDVVLMDIVLRGKMNGIKTAEDIYKDYDIPVIYLTAYADRKTLDKAKVTSPYGYILKPFEDQELYSTIEMAIYKHQMEKKLREREAWLSTTLKSIGDAVIVTDKNNCIQFMNSRAESLTGWRLGEVRGKLLKKVIQILREDTGKPAEDLTAQVLQKKKIVELTSHSVLVNRAGETVSIDESGAPIIDDKGRILGVVLALHDITNRRKAEIALQESNEFNYALFQYNPIETVVVDLEGRVKQFNLLKEKSGDRLPRTGDVMYKDYARSHEIDMYSEMMNAIQKQKVKKFPELKYKDKYLSITIAPFHQGAIITSQDITKRKLAEDTLSKSEREKSLILSSVSELVTFQNKEMMLLWANRAAAESVGLDPQEMVGRFCYNVWHQLESPCDDCPVVKAFKTGQPEEAEMTTANGKIWAVRGYPARNEAGEIMGVVEVTQDITNRKQTEVEKERIHAELIQAQKMEAIGTLTGGVAHDFNNLLTAIQGCSDMILIRTQETDPIYRDLKEIQIAADRAADLTRQLLLFSRKQPMEFAVINVNKTIENLLKMFHRLIGEDISISTSLAPDLLNVKADHGTIEQVIMNLAVNARDAMPDGGKLTIKTSNVTIDNAYSKSMPEARPGKFVRITVVDTGEGINEEILPHIFEPFFSTKGVGKGTGLGLSVVYGIIKQHEGWINVRSVKSSGTTFEIYLPGVRKKVDKLSDIRIPLHKFRGNGERILIVEDEISVRDFATIALSEYGYTIYSTSSVAEALDVFEREKGRFDLVLTDVVLPDRSGVDLVEELLTIKPGIKVLLSSGYTDQKSQWDKIQGKGLPFLQKPYTLATILQTVKEVLLLSSENS